MMFGNSIFYLLKGKYTLRLESPDPCTRCLLRKILFACSSLGYPMGYMVSHVYDCLQKALVESLAAHKQPETIHFGFDAGSCLARFYSLSSLESCRPLINKPPPLKRDDSRDPNSQGP